MIACSHKMIPPSLSELLNVLKTSIRIQIKLYCHLLSLCYSIDSRMVYLTPYVQYFTLTKQNNYDSNYSTWECSDGAGEGLSCSR